MENDVKNPTKKQLIVTVITTLTVLIVLTPFILRLFGIPLGECRHLYRPSKDSISAGEFEVGVKRSRCLWCKDTVTEREKATVHLPQLYLFGDTDGISKDNTCMMRAEYYDADVSIRNYATIKYQGHTSMAFEKKNYTIKFFSEPNESKKEKISVNGWEPTNKYCLKANYIDFSSSRNVVSANVWSEVVASRKDLDENIAELEHRGAIDGYPIALFINDVYQGIYTFNIPKDEDTYKIADEENEAMFVINSAFSDAANFRAPISEQDKKAVFDLEYIYPEDTEWAYDSIDKLIAFVIENDGENFKNGIHNYLDVDAAIDYLICAYVLGVTDNFSKNMILLTYDGQIWIPSMYDLDTACGLAFDGTGYFDHGFSLPTIGEGGVIYSGTESLLWDRILNNYTEELTERYFELRAGILATEKLVEQYCSFVDSIPDSCYDRERELYPKAPGSSVDQKEQISSFLTSRCEALDIAISTLNEVKK